MANPMPCHGLRTAGESESTTNINETILHKGHFLASFPSMWERLRYHSAPERIPAPRFCTRRDGLLYLRRKIYVPPPVHQEILRLHHCTLAAGHGGAQKTEEELIQCLFWWPAMCKQIIAYVSACQKLSPRFIGPFPVLEMVGIATVRLQLSNSYRIHPVFHISSDRLPPPPVEIAGETEVQQIFDSRERPLGIPYSLKRLRGSGSFLGAVIVFFIPDSENCQTCLDNEWPDEKKVKCIPKTYDFLSYKDDIMVPVFFFISVFFLILSFFVLGIFILYWDTPTVRANNRNLSFPLLVSIMLSFLCVFLFLGRPEDVTCMLRQTAFGVIFSVAVSCVLAKTLMVCIAFKATKPGSYWKKWMGAKVSNIIVLMCSSIQVFITIIWLAISPPFQELDMHSYNEKIIIQCNEGSVIAFYCVLGYLGLLAAVSFIIAFLARTLPDSFNEAKYITFSMLVFCSVWIAMIPAYLSTKGKYMVAVEIFAILASTAGLLSFMFFPKCYIL
ncbi:vomeronasal type-2 receptor 26-like, partial [Spea bombifrons]|uniref:vomeronasal type-2 receptor 26-like n=1 Tax=Spea bombifrons TaxID=233779 RepID=UPI00234B98C3